MVPRGQALHLSQDPVMCRERFILMYVFPCGCHVPRPQGLDCGFPTGAFYKIHTACFPLHRYIWIPQGLWGHMVQFTGMFLLQPGCAAWLFLVLVLLKVGIFPCHPSTGGAICLGVECTFSRNQRGLPDAVLHCDRGCKMKPFVFYFDGKSSSILLIIRHLETVLKWKILEIHRVLSPIIPRNISCQHL